jgi:L-aspartate oxidase
VAVPVSADFLIIGSGIAGLRAAIELAPHGRVLVLTKSEPRAGSTGYAQGGIAAALGPDDSPERHAADTIGAGDRLCDARAVEVLVREGPRYVQELLTWGADFDRAPDGSLDLAREGAHSVRRVLHAKDATGREIARTLAHRLISQPSVTVLPHAVAVQAIVNDGVVMGARFLDAGGALQEARAGATLLATGGAGQVYRETTNPDVATGDGMALAYFAGARVTDLEFVQFHPTVLAVAGAPRYLLSEALRGEGARLVNQQGEPFMARYAPEGDLAARDRVARAIVRESERSGGPVYLTLSHLPPSLVHARFPLIADLCRRAIGCRSGRRPITSWAASPLTSTAARRFRVCLQPARWRVPASTARTVWRATRSSKVSSSAAGRAAACGIGAGAPGPSRRPRRGAIRRRKERRSIHPSRKR